MSGLLVTEAEFRAKEAESLPAFGSLNLQHIKRELAIILGLIGRNGVFDEYTRHNIDHVNEMLKILQWLIPDKTKAVMSPADWLLTVLAIYFHDLGMLVTKQEFENRTKSGFPAYRDNELFAGDAGVDYRAKVEGLPPDKAERFLYQEFVRHKHAERIRAWVMGRASEHLGIAHEVTATVDNLLQPLGVQFRRDLARVCESHHLDDLSDFAKYNTSESYGNSSAETANLHYAAVLLRTADLLQISSDRTPSVAFRLINPTDPLSQEEWAKQMAVKRVCSQFGLDRDENPDENAPRDTIEVRAYFTTPDGFFGLTSYLHYAEEEIRRSYEWVQMAHKTQAAPHSFPWRYIDTKKIETEGFLSKLFEFSIDQVKILDLLTGHTLYNDTSVVLRELIQNALDAVRLQLYLDLQKNPAASPGKVKIHWNIRERTLTVEDNGTGMTQDIIEKHLLKVGASRYEDPEFKKEYPSFSAISRFGIGVLSAFMIADSVEIITCHPEEDRARQISLRSVHGKYLVRLLDKHSEVRVNGLGVHGTLIELKVRPSADILDVLETARRWIVVPGCEVSVSVDGGDPTAVRFPSPKEALLDSCRRMDIPVGEDAVVPGGLRVRVEQMELDGVTLAYAVEWSDYFQEWSFLDIERQVSVRGKGLIGTCVNGVRVEFSSPGFNNVSIAAIANAQGANAPRTNVARSGLEATPERDAMLRAVYSILGDHVRSEVKELHEKRTFSLTWAVHESRFLLQPLLIGAEEEREVLKPDILRSRIKELPIILVERDGKREAVSPADLCREPAFWTTDSQFFRSAESLISEISGTGSLSSLVNVFQPDNLEMPDGPLLCGFSPEHPIHEYALEGKEVDTVNIYESQRRVDLRWSSVSDPPRWIRLVPQSAYRRWGGTGFLVRSEGLGMGVLLGQRSLTTSGRTNEIAVRTFGITFLFHGSPAVEYLTRWVSENDPDQTDARRITAALFLGTLVGRLLQGFQVLDVREEADQFRTDSVRTSRLKRFRLEEVIDFAELQNVIDTTNWRCFNPSSWRRGNQD